MEIGIVTDSTCDLPSDLVEEYGIEIVPLNVHIDGETYKDREDLSGDEFYERQRNAENLPSTSQPSAGEFIKKYEALSSKYEKIVSIHLADELSGTLDSARLAKREVSGVEIQLIDSRAASLGIGLQVIVAAKLRKQGASFEDIINGVKKARDNMKIYFTVGELTYLKEGGRIGSAQAFVGSILNFNPILELTTKTGEIIPHSKIRGQTRTRKKMIDLVSAEISSSSEKVWLGMMNGQAGDVYEKFRSEIYSLAEQRSAETTVFETKLGPVIGSHVGPLVYSSVILKGDFLP